ncbi:hypothetical protein Tco_0150152 [Tanacetum coccineum]
MGKLHMISSGKVSWYQLLSCFGCPLFTHNRRDLLGKFDKKADDGYFLGYSLVAKAFKVHNIRRQEMEETFDPLSINKITILNIITPTTHRINSYDKSPQFSIADNHPVHNESDNLEPTKNLSDISETQNITKCVQLSTSKEGGKSDATSTQSKNVHLENSFSALNDDEDNEWKDNTTRQHSQQVLDVLNDSDSEVDEVITLDDHGGNLKTF